MAVPVDLQNAIDIASAQYGVNPDWLVRIWQFESGGTYPNPAVNSSGCGGLFGLCQGSSSIDPASGAPINLLASNTTQAQADASAYTLARLLNQFGNIYDAMIAYSGGSSAESSFVAGISQAVSNTANSVAAGLRAFYTSSITQAFGPTDLNLEPAYNGYAHFHQGIDLSISAGTPVPALTGGTVSNVVTGCGVGDTACGNGYGNQIMVRLADGSQVLYGHLQQVNTTIGQVINSGQIIGLSGDTGASTGPHIHIGLQNNAGDWIDPSGLIQGALAGNGLASGSTGTIMTGLPIVGGAISGIGDLLGKLSPGNILQSLGPALTAYFTQGVFLDPLFVGMGLLFVLIGALGLVLGHGDSKQTIKYVAAMA